MKKSKFLFLFIATLLALGSCNNIEETSSNLGFETPSTSTPSTSNGSNYKVILPKEIDGIEVSVDNLYPNEGEKVRVFIKNTLSTSIRVINVLMNGIQLEGNFTNIKNCKAYDFYMPSNRDASLSIQVADVYLVTVAKNVESILSLSGVGDGYFLEGEEVTFIPTTYAGYWYNEISLVDADVDLIKKDDGSYSFIMPNHTVTVAAVTGVNFYQVTYSEKNNPYVVSFDNGTSFEYGKEVKFSIVPSTSDIKINNVSSKGISINEQDGQYKFTMPAHPVYLDIEYVQVYKEFIAISSNNYDVVLKVIKGGNEVDVNSTNVGSNQKIYLDITKKSTSTESNIIIDRVEVYGGSSFETATTRLDNVELEGIRYSFTTLADYKCYKVVIIEKEENEAFVGTFRGIKMSDAYNMHSLLFSGGNEIKRNTYSGTVNKNHPYYEYIVADGYGTEYGYKAYVSPQNDAVLEFNTGYSWDGQEYPTTKGYFNSSLSIYASADLISNNLGEVDAFSIITCDNAAKYGASEYYSEFIVLSRLDGTLITCFYEFESSKVYWNVNYNITGVDGKTEGDVVEVISAEGESLVTMKVGAHKTAFQSRAVIIN